MNIAKIFPINLSLFLNKAYLFPIFVPNLITVFTAEPADQFCFSSNNSSHIRETTGEVNSWV